MHKPFNKQVVLYSGGMDSFIMGHMFPDALKLYINSGSPYANKEVRRLPIDVEVVRDVLDLSMYEREDSIVPSRNAYLALVAANYGDEIMLGATAGDMSTDKDPRWADHMTALLRYMLSGKHFNPPRDIHVTLPIKHMTKGDLVQWYLEQGHDVEKLIRVVSCYSPDYLHCGVCKACTRKWLALEAHGIDTHGMWHTHPTEAPWGDVVSALESPDGWRSRGEDAYTRRVLQHHGLMS